MDKEEEWNEGNYIRDERRGGGNGNRDMEAKGKGIRENGDRGTD